VQDINLYQPKSKGVRGALSAGSTATTLGIVVAALAGLWGFAWWQVKGLNDAASVVRNQQAAQAAMSAAQGPQLDNLTDEELAALVAQLSASIENKNRALALLASEDGAAAGFSRRLHAFGARHIDGIWLDRLTLGSTVQSVSVSGSTLSPDNVPRYLRSLAQDPALKGGQIDDFIIEQPGERQSAQSGQSGQSGRLTFRAGRRGLVAPAPAAEES
jgi:hypothetical protein